MQHFLFDSISEFSQNSSLFDIRLIIGAIVFGSFLWLSFYVATRNDNNILTVLSCLALFSQAVFFFSTELVTISPSIELNHLLARWFWWDTTLALVVWYHITWLIKQRTSLNSWIKQPFSFGTMFKTYIPVSAIIFYAIDIVCIYLGSFTDLMMNYPETYPAPGYTDRYYTDGGQFFFLLLIPTLIAPLGAIVNLVNALLKERREQVNPLHALEPQIRWLICGAILFCLGALYTVFNLNFDLHLPDVIYELLAIIGSWLFGYGIARYTALISGKSVLGDFFYGLTAVTVPVCAYAVFYLIIIGANTVPSVLMLFVLIALVIVSHITIDRFRLLFSRPFISDGELEKKKIGYSLAAEATIRSVEKNSDDLGNTQLDTAETVGPIANSQDELVSGNRNWENEIASTTTSKLAVGLNENDFRQEVKDFITNYSKPAKLANSPLLQLKRVSAYIKEIGSEDTKAERIEAAKRIILKEIKRFDPNEISEEDSEDVASWEVFQILYTVAVRGKNYPQLERYLTTLKLNEDQQVLTSKELNERKTLSELRKKVAYSTFQAKRNEAINIIALRLFNQEVELSQRLFSPEG